MMSIISERERASARAWFSSRPTRRCALTRASSSRTRNGLGMKSAAPRPSERTVASSGGIEEIIRTGRSLNRGSDLTRCSSWRPSTLGIMMSSRSRSNGSAAEMLEQMLAAGDGEHVVAVLLEDPGQRAGERLVVVGHEDLGSDAHDCTRR